MIAPQRPWLTSYADDVPVEIPVQTRSLVDLLDTSVDRHRKHTALDFFGATTSYEDLGEQVARVAGGLRSLGVTAGDRVALVMPNCPQHVVAFFAVLRLGAIVVEHNPLYTAPELRAQFANHGATVAIVWDTLADTVAAFPDDVRVEHIVAVSLPDAMPFVMRMALKLPLPSIRARRRSITATPTAKRVHDWERLAEHRRLSRRHPRPTPTDTALLQYTSGTTGVPKGAILTHANLVANAAQGRAWTVGVQEGGETVYAVLPLFHAYGMTLCLTYAMSIGATLVLLPRWDLDLAVKAMKRRPPTFIPAVPPIYDALARAAADGRVDLSTVRYAISGAMSLPVATVERWESASGGLLVEGYGLTETSPVALGNPIGPSRRPGTVGVPFPSTEIRVVDPEDTGIDRAPGEAGELLIRGPQVFGGYWRRPDETAAVLLPDGWLRTGDIVVMAEDGFVTVVDRIKELIVTGGFNVAPTEVEDTLVTHPDIEGAAVVGLKEDSGSETVVAAVVLRKAALLDADAFRAFAKERLAAYKVPRRFVQVDEIPRSLIGKVLRREVRERLQATELG